MRLSKPVSKLTFKDFQNDDILDEYAAIADDETLNKFYKKAEELDYDPDTIRGQILERKIEADKYEKERKKEWLDRFGELTTAEELLKKDLPDPITYVGVDREDPILVEGTNILSAKPKVGKSWYALSETIAICSGENFLDYKTRKCSCLYFDLETSENIQQKRIKKALHGKPCPKNLYIKSSAPRLDEGFIELLEHYLNKDPNIGVIVIDVFEMIRTPALNRNENDYQHAYRDITPLNKLAQEKHLSIILVTHDRKMIDPDDPFSNILGSTGLQGAVTQMTVMYRRKRTQPIHISVKGKTIDALPELDVDFENATWSLSNKPSEQDIEEQQALDEYMHSNIRTAIKAIAEKCPGWSGRSSEIIERAAEYGIPIFETSKHVGLFLHQHIGRFLGVDKITIAMSKNIPNKPTVYRISPYSAEGISLIEEAVDF